MISAILLTSPIYRDGARSLSRVFSRRMELSHTLCRLDKRTEGSVELMALAETVCLAETVGDDCPSCTIKPDRGIGPEKNGLGNKASNPLALLDEDGFRNENNGN